MSPSEIKSFEDFWKLFTAFFYDVIDFIRKTFKVEGLDKINPIY